MEPWLEPLYDAEGMRAADRWAIEEQGVASLELMEAAGRALAEAVAGLAPQGPVRVVCGKGNNGGDGWSRPGSCAGWASRSRSLWPAGASDAAATWTLDAAGVAAGSGAVVDAIFGTGFAGSPRRARRRRDRGDQPLRGAGRRLRHRLRGRRLQRRGRGGRGRGRPHRQLPRRQGRPARRARQVGHAASCGWCRSGSRPGAPASRPAATIDPAVLALLPRRGARSTKFSSGQVTIAGGSRGLTGAVRMSSLAAIRAGAGYATVAVPADLEPIFEAGRARGDVGRLPRRRRLPGAGLGEAAARRLRARRRRRARPGPRPRRGLAGRWPARWSRAIDGAAGDRRRRPERLRRRARRARRPRRRRPSSPRTRASSAACSSATPSEIDAHRLACAREAAARSGAVVVLKGDDTIVTDGERVAVNAVSGAGAGDRRQRRRPLRHDRGAARPRPRALRRRLRRGPRPRPRRPRGGRAGSALPSR